MEPCCRIQDWEALYDTDLATASSTDRAQMVRSACCVICAVRC